MIHGKCMYDSDEGVQSKRRRSCLIRLVSVLPAAFLGLVLLDAHTPHLFCDSSRAWSCRSGFSLILTFGTLAKSSDGARPDVATTQATNQPRQLLTGNTAETEVESQRNPALGGR